MKLKTLKTLKPRLQQIGSALPTLGRLGATSRLRGSALQTRRERWFTLHPLCVTCDAVGRTAAARELDHITPLWAGGLDAEPNLQGLCVPCHAAKTALEARHRASATG